LGRQGRPFLTSVLLILDGKLQDCPLVSIILRFIDADSAGFYDPELSSERSCLQLSKSTRKERAEDRQNRLRRSKNYDPLAGFRRKP
jgi:hypothetical protein